MIFPLPKTGQCFHPSEYSIFATVFSMPAAGSNEEAFSNSYQGASSPRYFFRVFFQGMHLDTYILWRKRDEANLGQSPQLLSQFLLFQTVSSRDLFFNRICKLWQTKKRQIKRPYNSQVQLTIISISRLSFTSINSLNSLQNKPLGMKRLVFASFQPFSFKISPWGQTFKNRLFTYGYRAQRDI